MQVFKWEAGAIVMVTPFGTCIGADGAVWPSKSATFSYTGENI